MDAEKVATPTGKFYGSLARNAKSIRTDRAEQIAEAAETKYRRRVEDLRMALRDIQRQREASIDLSPDTTIGLALAKGFDADKFVHIEPIEKLLARWAGIDLNKLEDEKLAMLAEQRKLNEEESLIWAGTHARCGYCRKVFPKAQMEPTFLRAVTYPAGWLCQTCKDIAPLKGREDR